MSKKVVYGIYDDEEVLLTAVKEIRSKDISIKKFIHLSRYMV